MAAMDDRAGAVATSSATSPQLRPGNTGSPSREGAVSDSRPLDTLPTEVLLEIASWLDWRSLRSLGDASRRCQDMVSSHLGRLRVFHVREFDLEDWGRISADLILLMTQMMTQMRSLRELHVEVYDSEDLLEALLAHSRSWPLLEKLNLDLHFYPTDLLEDFCAGFKRLTEVTLGREACDEVVEAVLAGRPNLLVLNINNKLSVSSFDDGLALEGAFIARLPAKLRRLSVACRHLHSSALRNLAHCVELRSLELDDAWEKQGQDLATGLAGCVRLERLLLGFIDGPFIDCLPPAGLPTLRCLELTCSSLTDSDLRQLVTRLPNLQSVCLRRFGLYTERGLALLGRLPSLTSLKLFRVDGVSDWALAQLSATRLTELRVGNDKAAFDGSLTAEGLLRLTQTCPSLRTITLWFDDLNMKMETAKCGPGTDELRLLGWLRAGLAKMTSQYRLAVARKAAADKARRGRRRWT